LHITLPDCPTFRFYRHFTSTIHTWQYVARVKHKLTNSSSSLRLLRNWFRLHFSVCFIFEVIYFFNESFLFFFLSLCHFGNWNSHEQMPKINIVKFSGVLFGCIRQNKICAVYVVEHLPTFSYLLRGISVVFCSTNTGECMLIINSSIARFDSFYYISR
jgi:hypothetical protein